MTDMLKTGSDWLSDQQKMFVSKAVTYRRGSASVRLQATIGKTVFEIQDAGGGIESYESRDYLVHAADLVLASATTLPARGDKIDEVQGAATYTYEVMAPQNEPVFRYSDNYRKRLRIHTKLVSTA